VFWAGAGAVVAQDFRVRRHKSAQSLRVLKIHGADLVGAEIALFFYGRLVVIGWTHNFIDKNDKIDIIEQNFLQSNFVNFI
jgi:hypothetical protein